MNLLLGLHWKLLLILQGIVTVFLCYVSILFVSAVLQVLLAQNSEHAKWAYSVEVHSATFHSPSHSPTRLGSITQHKVT